jgi:pentatricopeptide repeat protein
LVAYNIVMDAWSKSRVPEAPEAVERLLKRMRDAESVQPNTYTYNLLIDAWANSNRDNSLEKVLQIYRHMETLSKDSKSKDVTPSIRTINAILHAYARKSAQFTSQNNQEGYDQAAKCASEAFDLLQETKKRFEETQDTNWQPDMATYTSVMDVHSRCATYKTTKIAGQLLEELKQLHLKTGNQRHKPNFRTYTTLVTAWSRTKSEESPQRVEAIMKEMTKCGENPNSRTYTAAIQCWSRARDPLKAKRVLKLLMEMRGEYKKTRSEHLRPTTITYNTAIDACARCQGSADQKTESLKIAFAILKTIEMDDELNADGVTYSTLIRSLGFLMPTGDERNNVAKAVFEKAKNAGLVELTTLKNLSLAVDAKTLKIAMDGNVDQNGNADYTNIPYAWRKNGNK